MIVARVSERIKRNIIAPDAVSAAVSCVTDSGPRKGLAWIVITEVSDGSAMGPSLRATYQNR